jgi:3-oxoacyl-[acyl-carrier protein] reductase
MDLNLKDKVIFVAGGSRGIGLGIVEACLAEGAKVALTARGAEALDTAQKRLTATYGEGRVWTMAGDMRDSATIDKSLDAAELALGPLWGAVANVGLFDTPPGFDIADENWDGALSQNLDSAYRLARAALRRMTPRKEGAFLFISSIAGLGALGTPLTYGTSKAAMNHLSKELAKIVGASGVRVNTIAPGNIIFPGGDWESRSTGERADSWAAGSSARSRCAATANPKRSAPRPPSC